MATFKVGQRVKYTVARDITIPLSAEGLVVLPLGFHPGSADTECARYGVEFDGYPCPVQPGTYWCALPEHLVPLTDPGADAFLESIRKLKPLHEEPKVERTRNPADRVRVGDKLLPLDPRIPSGGNSE